MRSHRHQSPRCKKRNEGDSKRTNRPESPGTIIPRNIMKRKISLNAISSLLMGLATASAALAGFAPWIIAIMAVSTGLLGMKAGFTGKDQR